MYVCMYAGFAIGSAALVSLALFGAFVVRIRRAALLDNTSMQFILHYTLHVYMYVCMCCMCCIVKALVWRSCSL